MCGPITSDESSVYYDEVEDQIEDDIDQEEDEADEPVQAAVQAKPKLNALQKRQAIRVFRQRMDNLVYLIDSDGNVSFIDGDVRSDQINRSGNFSNAAQLLAAEEAGLLVELTLPSAPTLADRLKAAEGDTGFKLFDLVKDQTSGEYGKIVGFGRVNEENGVVSRALLVDIGNEEVFATLPENVALAVAGVR